MLGAPMRILVCEDDPARREEVARALEARGHAVVRSSGREAADAAGRETVDAIVYDWLMPESWELRLAIERTGQAVKLVAMKRAAEIETVVEEAEALMSDRPLEGENKLPIAVLARRLEQLASQLPPEVSQEQVQRLADRARSMAEYVAAFGWQESREPALVDVRRPLNLALEIVLPELKHRARLQVALEEAPLVYAVEHELAHVFFDLLINAVQAIEKGAPEKNLIEVGTCGREDGFALITVRDTGCGIAPDVLPRIFDPMFTTKSAEGQGLGLYVCQLTVAALGGEILIDSEVGRGTAFTLALPGANVA
jgi:signal transduction histidine kinase